MHGEDRWICSWINHHSPSLQVSYIISCPQGTEMCLVTGTVKSTWTMLFLWEWTMERLTHFTTSPHNTAVLLLTKFTNTAKYTQYTGIHLSSAHSGPSICTKTKIYKLSIVNTARKHCFKFHPADLSYSLERLSAVEKTGKVFLCSICSRHCKPLQPLKAPKDRKLNIISLTLKQTSERSGATNWHDIASVWESAHSGRKHIQSSEDFSECTAVAEQKQERSAERES